MSNPYSPEWFSAIQEDSSASARAIVPVVMELVHPRSVVDMGCGTGEWLAAFLAAGAETIMGIDGDYVNRSQLKIPLDRFVPADLTRPPSISSRFDLAISLEVAEHLPPQSAPALVDSLCRLAPVVLFSAAIPFQGGNKHLNEQWPEYWEALFAERSYDVVDCLRLRFWQNPQVAWYYAQNMMFFVDRRQLSTYPSLEQERQKRAGAAIRLIHPQRYLMTASVSRFSFGDVLRSLPGFICRAIQKRWQRWFSFSKPCS